MGLFVNTNIASLNARRYLLRTGRDLAKSFERLSSGVRINNAGDDASGLAITTRMTSQVRGLNRAKANAGDGIGLTRVAEGALQETATMLQRIRELAIQAASDVNTGADRLSIQDEVNALMEEIERIGSTTRFNEQRLLNGDFKLKKFQIGSNFRERFDLSISDARASALARYAVQTGAPVTSLALGTGDLMINGLSIRATRPQDDQVSNSLSLSSAIAKANAINDASEFTGVSAYVNEAVRPGGGAVIGGTLNEVNTLTINGRIISSMVVAPDDADDQLIRAINQEAEITGVLAKYDKDRQLVLTAIDGRNIEVVASGNAAAITGLGASDVTLGTMTLNSADQFVLGANVAGAEARIGFPAGALIGVTGLQAVDTIDLTSRQNANLAILIVDRALGQVSGLRSDLGAVQNRLESTVNQLSAISENLTAARSRMLDADFAEESANLARNQILQQAATTILSQANSQPQNALSLLQG